MGTAPLLLGVACKILGFGMKLSYQLTKDFDTLMRRDRCSIQHAEHVGHREIDTETAKRYDFASPEVR